MKARQYLICGVMLCVTLLFTGCGTRKVDISPETLEQLRTQYESGTLIVDYNTAEDFESALNDGTDVLEKTVKFVFPKFHYLPSSIELYSRGELAEFVRKKLKESEVYDA